MSTRTYRTARTWRPPAHWRDSSPPVLPIVVTTEVKIALAPNRNIPASATGPLRLLQGMTNCQRTFGTSGQTAPATALDGRNTSSVGLIRSMTSPAGAAPVVYNTHIFGWGATNPWPHPPSAVNAYQQIGTNPNSRNWVMTGSQPYLQEAPYFYKDGTVSSTANPVEGGQTVRSDPAQSNPGTSGMDHVYDVNAALGTTPMITLCMGPSWMSGLWQTTMNHAANAFGYSTYDKNPPISYIATDNTTLLTHATNVPAELLTLSASTTPPAGKSLLADGKRGLYMIDYWKFLVKQLVRRYCLKESLYLTAGLTHGSASQVNPKCQYIQIWNEFGGIDFASGTVGGNIMYDTHIPEELTTNSGGSNMWDWGQVNWLYGHTYQAILEAVTGAVNSSTGANYTSIAAAGIQIAGPYIPLRWNYYSSAGVARSTPPVKDTDSSYYGLAHRDQYCIANWFMCRAGTGNAWPARGPGISARSGTVPSWTPISSGSDRGVVQYIPPYDMDLLCFDGLQRRHTDPIGQAVNGLPDRLEPARTPAEWLAQQLIDTPNYAACYQDMAQLAINCGKPGTGIVQSENYLDVLLDSENPISGDEYHTGTNHQIYYTHAYQHAQTASQWLWMAKGGGTMVLRWQPEGLAINNMNAATTLDPVANVYYPEWAYRGNQQSLWMDSRNLSGYKIGQAPLQRATDFDTLPGYPFPLYTSFANFTAYFSLDSTGQPRHYYEPAITTPAGAALPYTIDCIDNGTHLLLINKDTASHTVTLVQNNVGTVLTLAAYEVRLVSLAP